MSAVIAALAIGLLLGGGLVLFLGSLKRTRAAAHRAATRRASRAIVAQRLKQITHATKKEADLCARASSPPSATSGPRHSVVKSASAALLFLLVNRVP